jgi:phosphatidylserine decarboxylase
MPSDESVQYYNRYSRKVETEAIYGEKYLKFIYGNPIGKLALWAAVKRAWFSGWYGKRMNSPLSVKKILPFIECYGLNSDDFLLNVDEFKCFDDFFSRKLKPAKRPIEHAREIVVFPADGRHLAINNISIDQPLWAKGQRLKIEKLLGGHKIAERYEGGSVLVSRLCPTDYHRFHFPCDGKASSSFLINGFLYSVNPMALKRNISYLWHNRRYITELDSDEFGSISLVEIGATCVGGIKQTYDVGNVIKGSEKGFFHFGGSMTMIFFEKGKIIFSEDLLENGKVGREVYGRMGDHCARAL